MSETTPPAIEATVTETPAEPKPNVLVRTRTKFPRAYRAAQLTAAGLGLVVATRAVTNAQHNKAKLEEAVDHAKEAGDALSDAVVMPDDES